MLLLGSIDYSFKNKILIVKSSEQLELKEASKLKKKKVFLKTGVEIGEISEIFGSIREPYISIKPAKNLTQEKINSALNMPIYIEE